MSDEELRLEALKFALEESSRRRKMRSPEGIVAVADVFYEFLAEGYDNEDDEYPDDDDGGGGQELPVLNDNTVTRIAAISVH